MIPDVHDRLAAVRDGLADPAERAAFDVFLADNTSIQATLSVIDGEAVWLLAGERGQIAGPLAMFSGLTQDARDNGDIQKFYDALEAEVCSMLAQVHSTLFPEN